MSIPKPGEYGEPWDESDYYRETDPMVFGEHSLPIPAFNRAMACVNAMNGRDPAELAPLEGRMKDALSILRLLAYRQCEDRERATTVGNMTKNEVLEYANGLESAARAFGTIRE